MNYLYFIRYEEIEIEKKYDLLEVNVFEWNIRGFFTFDDGSKME